VPAKKAGTDAPKSMIHTNEDLLGGVSSTFKPYRRQIEHRDEEMKEVPARPKLPPHGLRMAASAICSICWV